MAKESQSIFLSLLRAGLWEQKCCHISFCKKELQEVYRLSQEQAVVGLIAAGLEQVIDFKVPREIILTFASDVLQLEQRNIAMNNFVSELVSSMLGADINFILVKGQGIAQCYERPLWRACGDVDMLLSGENYRLAKEKLSQIASEVDEENLKTLHLGMTIKQWVVELHGTLRSGLWHRLDRGIDEAQAKVLYGGSVRSWANESVQILLPGINEDIIFVFSHILQHFFIGGIGLRQICDWCRLLWKYRNSTDYGLLEQRLREMKAMSEWRAFANLAVNYLGYPSEVMPLYDDSSRWSRKSKQILSIMIETGNMGHKRDVHYQHKYPMPLRKLITFGRITKDAYNQFLIFPKDALIVWWKMLTRGFEH